MEDKTFIVHGDWLTAIQGLTIEQQDAVIGDLVRYGVEFDLAHGDQPEITAMVNLLKGKIDYSKIKYANKVQGGKNNGRRKKYSNKQIYDLAQEHMDSSQEIANILGCSKSTIDHSDGWRLRKDPNAVFLE